MKYLKISFTLLNLGKAYSLERIRPVHHARRYDLHIGRVSNENVDAVARQGKDYIRVLPEITGRRVDSRSMR